MIIHIRTDELAAITGWNKVVLVARTMTCGSVTMMGVAVALISMILQIVALGWISFYRLALEWLNLGGHILSRGRQSVGNVLVVSVIVMKCQSRAMLRTVGLGRGDLNKSLNRLQLGAGRRSRGGLSLGNDRLSLDEGKLRFGLSNSTSDAFGSLALILVTRTSSGYKRARLVSTAS